MRGRIANPGDRERYLASKRAEMDKGVRGGGLRGTFEDTYVRATRYTLSLRQCAAPHYLTVSYLFWGDAEDFLPWVRVARVGEDGTTGAFAARPFLEGMYVGEVGGDHWGGVGSDARIPASLEVLDFAGDSLGVFTVRRGAQPQSQEDEILHGWVFRSVQDLAGGLSMARLSRTPNTWLSWQGHAITSRPVQLGGELFLRSDLQGSTATDQTVVAELEGLGRRGS
eukprot:jgi/Mesvir1/27791/Mv07472-RA.1